FTTPVSKQAVTGSSLSVLLCPSDNRVVFRNTPPNAGTNYAGMYSGGQFISSNGRCPNPPIQQTAGTECPIHGGGDSGGGMSYLGRTAGQMIDGPSAIPMVGEVWRGRQFERTQSPLQSYNNQRCYDWIL